MTAQRPSATIPTIAPPAGGAPVGLTEAAQIIGRTVPEVLDLLDERHLNVDTRGAPQPWDIPEPLPVPPSAKAAAQRARAAWREHRHVTRLGQPMFHRARYRSWALRVGWHVGGYGGTPVIGYAGLARVTGLKPQTLRVAGLATSGRLPAPIFYMGHARIGSRPGDRGLLVALFDPQETMRWARQTRHLPPL